MIRKVSNYGLIISDMQNDKVLPGSPLRVAGAKTTIPVILKALNVCRALKLPIFHIVREYRPDGSDIEVTRLSKFMEVNKGLVPGTPGCNIVDELRPMPGEYKIVKNRFSAFMNTELDFILRRLNVNELVVCGTEYPGCIRTTVFDGISYGYNVTVLTDATSAKSQEIADANIRDMQDYGVDCIETNVFLKKLK
ncbi:MAG TPA: isochorismatase family cysteine hydrolase [Victivallales bacterium]|nr:isochorismatase family cysteine hydrolase [Victivallales bacterium]